VPPSLRQLGHLGLGTFFVPDLQLPNDLVKFGVRQLIEERVGFLPGGHECKFYRQILRCRLFPEPQVPSRSAEFLDCLCSERPPGWVSAGCALLDASTDSRLEFWEAIDRLRDAARSRGKVQRVALEFTEPTPLLFCAVVGPDEVRPTLLASLQAKVVESLDQFGAQRVLALGSVVSSDRAFDALTVIDGLSSR